MDDVKGIRNTGNTCYAISLIQCLYSIDLIRNTNCELVSLFKRLMNNYNANDIKTFISYNPYTKYGIFGNSIDLLNRGYAELTKFSTIKQKEKCKNVDDEFKQILQVNKNKHIQQSDLLKNIMKSTKPLEYAIQLIDMLEIIGWNVLHEGDSRVINYREKLKDIKCYKIEDWSPFREGIFLIKKELSNHINCKKHIVSDYFNSDENKIYYTGRWIAIQMDANLKKIEFEITIHNIFGDVNKKYELKSILYTIPNFHYFACVKRNNKWYKIDNATVSSVSEPSLIYNRANIDGLFYEEIK